MLEGLFDIQEQTTDGTKKVYQVKVNPAHEVFRGHFPEQPVLPGVAMVYLSRFLTERVTGKAVKLKDASQIKFLNLVDPRINPEFTYTNEIVKEVDNVIYVKGEMRFNEMTFFKILATYN
ncbi:MAG: Beta-hydroxyacyl-(acyl-carrier-protein) dehydratase, FabA/FabZ [Chitinophagaceae bacterium]|nr:Beta-hydroxyacyl-(acyl-carrier-protein) dehydratase, FabA/FabZ [Chitinophagaceae bacterium]